MIMKYNKRMAGYESELAASFVERPTKSIDKKGWFCFILALHMGQYSLEDVHMSSEEALLPSRLSGHQFMEYIRYI